MAAPSYPHIPAPGKDPDPGFSRRIILGILSGVMLTACFPPVELAWMAWLAVVPLLKAVEGLSIGRAFKFGLIAGMVHYLTLLYWIVVVLGHYGNLSPLASLGPLFLLCLYLALYPAVFSGLTTRFEGSRFFPLLVAGLWTGLEYGRTQLLSGFPWCLMGHTQYRYLSVIQIADLFGVYGVSFLILLSNGLIYALLLKRPRERWSNLAWQIPFAVLLLVATLAYAHQDRSARHAPESQCRYRIAIVQANIDQSVKWDPAYQAYTMSVYRRLTESALVGRPDLIVWPETAVPFFYQDRPALSREITRMAKDSGVPFIFGSPAYTHDPQRTRYFNRAYMLSPDGTEPPQSYDKVHLVPFGEYVPLKRFLFFIERLVPAAGDFEAGEAISPLRSDEISAGILICFEVIFPELARIHAGKGANLLVNLTNDAWFGMTGAPFQHLSMAVFRAVETRKPLIRAANTGFSAFINARGKILKKSSLFEEEVLVDSVSLGGSDSSLYTRIGDLFAIGVLGLVLLVLLLQTLGRRPRPY